MRALYAVFLALVLGLILAGQDQLAADELPAPRLQSAQNVHESAFTPGPSFQVGEVPYPSAHDFDSGAGVDTCLSVSVPPGDIFTLSLTWDALFDGPPGAGDLDLYIYSDSNCTPSALLTSSFNSNAYTGELLEITPQVKNVGNVTAVGGVRIGRRSGRGNPGLLRLSVLTGAATFDEFGTGGPPLSGQEGAPIFTFNGPFSVIENSPAGTLIGTVTAEGTRPGPLTFFELDPAVGQASFQIESLTGAISVEDPSALDREASASFAYWIGVTDGTSASVISVGIDLAGVNDNAPVALPSGTTTAPGTSIAILLSGADADVDPAQQLAFRIVSQPSAGLLSSLTQVDYDSASLTYSPTPGFSGIDTFTFEVDDGLSTSAPATVSINVTNQPPTPTSVPGAQPTATPEAGSTPTAAPGQSTPTPGTGGGGGGGSVLPTPTSSAAPGIPISPPSAPRFLNAEPGDSSTTISWQRPLSAGGEPISGYRVFNINTARSTVFQGDITSARISGLENGTAYLFQVRAFNSAGLGDADLVGPVTPVTSTASTIEVQASLHPDDSVTVWWSPPTGTNVAPVSIYRIWTEDGQPAAAVTPGSPQIVNITDIENDSWQTFRVTAYDNDGEIIATGLTPTLYIPPTLASRHEPLPDDAILIELTDQAQTALQTALQSAAGVSSLVKDHPLVLTVRNGVAELFVEVEGLHRAVVLPPGFSVESEQLAVTESPTDGLSTSLEIAIGVYLAGSTDPEFDPTGMLMQIPESVLRFSPDWTALEGLAPVYRMSIDYGPLSLSPDFSFEASVPVELSTDADDSLEAASFDDVAGIVEIVRSGIGVAVTPTELVQFDVETDWYDQQVIAGRTVSVFRFDNSGLALAVDATCKSVSEPGDSATGQTSCTAELDGDGGSKAIYALVSGIPGSQPAATPIPTPQNAPTDPPVATLTPTPDSGSSLVVVESQPSPTPTVGVSSVPQSTPIPQPIVTATPTSLEPLLPESGGGGIPAVTWLISGLLGLVVIRGAFYAVGKIKS